MDVVLRARLDGRGAEDAGILIERRARIGRAHGNEVRIPSSEVSRRHCELRVDDGMLKVEDLDSITPASFLELVPHAQLVEIGGAAHTAAGDDNDSFTDAVAKFVVQLRHS